MEAHCVYYIQFNREARLLDRETRRQVQLISVGEQPSGVKYLGEESYSGHFLYSLSTVTLVPKGDFVIPLSLKGRDTYPQV